MKPLKTCCNYSDCGCRLRMGSLIAGSICLTISTVVLAALIYLKASDDFHKNYPFWLMDSFSDKRFANRCYFTSSVMLAAIPLLILAVKREFNHFLPCFLNIPSAVLMSFMVIGFVCEDIQGYPEDSVLRPSIILNSFLLPGYVFYKICKQVYADYRLNIEALKES